MFEAYGGEAPPSPLELAEDAEGLFDGAVAEGMGVADKVGSARLHAITGHAPPYIFPVARYLWFRNHHDASRVATLLMLNDWITYLLSGERVAEHSNAGESMLYDVSRRTWSTSRWWSI